MANVRRGHEGDYDPVIALWVDAGLGQPTDDEWRAITIGPTARLLVATEDREVVGAAVVSFDGWRGYIYHVAVAASQQRKGVAQDLVAEAERHIRHEGGTRIFAFVSGDNVGGVALCRATGFQSEGDVGFVKDLAEAVVAG